MYIFGTNPFRNFKQKVKRFYYNQLGFHTDRKIIVIESDDWGSIRMPSKKTLDVLIQKDEKTAQDAFLTNDSLETVPELERLFEMLTDFTDLNGRHPCITANFAVANPDFDRINYQTGNYFYESFEQTYERYYGKSKQTIEIIKNAKDKHIFVPQLHAREHLNVDRWMRDIKGDSNGARLAFEYKTFGIGSSFSSGNYFGYMDAYNYDTTDEFVRLRTRIVDASEIFTNVFGFRSVTTAAPCFVWTKQIEKVLSEIGVKLFQTQLRQNVCVALGTENMRPKLHYTGQKNRLGQLYSVRNCSYEPTISGSVNQSVDGCLLQIQESFLHNRPAVINSHRLNYISSINKDNGTNGIKGLHLVLKKVLEVFPDTEFMSSDELFALMNSTL